MMPDRYHKKQGGDCSEWRQEMTFRVQLIGCCVLVCALFFGGCGFLGIGGTSKASLDEVKRTPAEEQKARVLEKIDRKYENPDAHYELGKLYQADGLWSQAEHEYNITLSFAPAYREAQAAIVKVLVESGDTAKSELSADIYINQASGSAEGLLRLGLAFQKELLDEYALNCYQQALRLAPNSAKINRQIGYYYLSKGDKVQARDYLTRSFQLNPSQPEVAGELGRLGVAVRVPRKTQKDTSKLDKIVEKSDEQRQ
jgi:tetratricopeptide (TPR) repeat protein